MEISGKNIKYKDFSFDFHISSDEIIGIMGEGKLQLLKILNLDYEVEGNLSFDKHILKESNYNSVKKKISFITNDMLEMSFMKTVDTYMESIIRNRYLQIKDKDKKKKDALRIIGLNNNYLERLIGTLSSSEKKLIQIAASLLSNPEVILLEDPFLNLDMNLEKKMGRLFQKLKDQYHKTIIFTSDNSDITYKYTNEVFLLKNHEIIVSGKTSDIYKDVETLLKYKLEVPDIVMFSYKVRNKKNIKLDYHKDIRDIIKDIYKHV